MLEKHSGNIASYFASLSIFQKLWDDGLIDEKDLNKAERFLAMKYRIKEESIYRANDLINKPLRVIYMTEDRGDRIEDNKDRIVRIIERKN